MVKLISSLFTILIFSQSIGTYFGTVEEFQVLLEHAKVHSEEYGDNFIVFLSKHYGDMKEHHSHDDQDKENQHEDLPFTHNECSHSPVTLTETFIAFSLLKVESIGDRVSMFGYEDLYTSPYTSGIFQPPKNA